MRQPNSIIYKIPFIGKWLKQRAVDKLYKKKLEELRKRDPFIYKNR
jgi:hypothetical protein